MTVAVCSFLTMSEPGYDEKGWKSKMETTLSTSFAASGTRQANRMLCHVDFVSCVCSVCAMLCQCAKISFFLVLQDSSLIEF